MKTEVTENDDRSSHRKDKMRQVPVQAFPTWASSEILGQVILCDGCPVHGVLFSSTPKLHPLNRGSVPPESVTVPLGWWPGLRTDQPYKLLTPESRVKSTEGPCSHTAWR